MLINDYVKSAEFLLIRHYFRKKLIHRCVGYIGIESDKGPTTQRTSHHHHKSSPNRTSCQHHRR